MKFITQKQWDANMQRALRDGNARWEARQRALQSAGRATVEMNLQRIESRYELESDEFETAREKAKRISGNGNPVD